MMIPTLKGLGYRLQAKDSSGYTCSESHDDFTTGPQQYIATARMLLEKGDGIEWGELQWCCGLLRMDVMHAMKIVNA
jgi:hypothetical protein